MCHFGINFDVVLEFKFGSILAPTPHEMRVPREIYRNLICRNPKWVSKCLFLAYFVGHIFGFSFLNRFGFDFGFDFGHSFEPVWDLNLNNEGTTTNAPTLSWREVVDMRPNIYRRVKR